MGNYRAIRSFQMFHQNADGIDLAVTVHFLYDSGQIGGFLRFKILVGVQKDDPIAAGLIQCKITGRGKIIRPLVMKHFGAHVFGNVNGFIR